MSEIVRPHWRGDRRLLFVADGLRVSQWSGMSLLIDIGTIEIQDPFIRIDRPGRSWSFEKFKPKAVLKVEDQLGIVTYFQPKELIVRHQSIFGIVLKIEGKASRFDPDTDKAFRPVEKFDFGHGMAKIRS